MASSKRVAVLGGGPIGLECALAAANRGFQVTVFEKNESVAGHMESYNHVRLFSHNAMNMTEAGKEALKAVGAPLPDLNHCPSGREYVDTYLTPLSKHLATKAKIHFGTEVISVARGALNKMESIGGGDFRMPSNKPLVSKFRQDTPFDVLVSCNGEESREEGFDFVMDCTGFYKKEYANWAGKGGVPAVNERSLRTSGRIWNTVPDILGKDKARFAGKRTMLVGSGMSAATTVRFTTDLAKEAPGTELLWLVRSNGEPFKVNPDDPMEAHKKLEEFGNAASRGEVPGVQYLRGSAVRKLEKKGDRLAVTIQTVDGERVEEIDEFVSNCGFKPDTSIFQELQMQLCHATDGPYKLAATLMAGGQKSCLEQTFEGAETMKTFEPNYFILGHKSYGRSASFLLRIGHEQIGGVVDMMEEEAKK